MALNLMCFQVHLGVKYDKLLLETLPVRAQEMVLAEVDFQRVVVDVVLLLPATIASVADVAALMLVSAVGVQLVVPIEARVTEATFRMPPKAALVLCTRVVVAELLVLFQVWPCKELVFVGEDLLVPCTQITRQD
jgi:hypothetical protein